MFLKLTIYPNAAYSPDALTKERDIFTIGIMRDWLEGYDDDVPIILYDDSNNGRGACWGYIADVDESVEDEKED